MNSQLSNALPPLGTSANRIVNRQTGTPVLLRGVNRSGLEYSTPDENGFLSGASISRAEIETIVRDWRANIIRLPFNQDFVLRGRAGRSGEEYCAALDQIISWASSMGAYTLLDLQWLDADRIYGGDRNFVAPLPNVDSIELWRTLAARYKDEPAVLYDLFNEPHDRLTDDPWPLNKPDGATWPASQRSVTCVEWEPWAQTLAQTVRNENPDALIFIGGTNWAYDLSAMPMRLDNVVYSTHVYPNKGTNWQHAFGKLAATAPVFVGEFGCSDSGADLKWLRKLLAYLDELELGFTAWSWFNEPFLVTRANDAWVPTDFGRHVQQTLTRS